MSVLEYVKSKRIITLGADSVLSRVTTWVSTGCPPLDLIMGGGVPIGRCIEVYGDTSTGKTLLAQHILAECQAVGGTAVLMDSETAIDDALAQMIGVDIDNLIYSNPETVEQVYEDLVDLVDAKKQADPEGFMVIVWDSIAATSSEAEIEKVRKDGLSSGYPPTARQISTMLRVVVREIARANISFIMLNQTREKIGVMFGPNVATFGGKAPGFYSAIRLELAKKGMIKAKGKIVGINARAYVAKNKVAPPFGKCVLPILFDRGIDEAGAVLEWLRQEKLVTSRGGWLYIVLGGEEYSFRSDAFDELYNDNQETILEMMYNE